MQKMWCFRISIKSPFPVKIKRWVVFVFCCIMQWICQLKSTRKKSKKRKQYALKLRFYLFSPKCSHDNQPPRLQKAAKQILISRLKPYYQKKIQITKSDALFLWFTTLKHRKQTCNKYSFFFSTGKKIFCCKIHKYWKFKLSLKISITNKIPHFLNKLTGLLHLIEMWFKESTEIRIN